MALKGAQIIASLSAWPAARTATAENLQDDRWTYRFNLFDAARALDNQVFWIAANQSGTFGSLRYVGNAKVVDPGGNTLATTLLGRRHGRRGRRHRRDVPRHAGGHVPSARPQARRLRPGHRRPMAQTSGRNSLMPEMTFDVRWPDGRVQQCYSPSLVMHDYLTSGSDYTVAEFLDRSAKALREASERVRAKFGFACTSAAATNEKIIHAATRFAPDATIRVVAMQPGLEDVMNAEHVTVAVIGGGQAGLSVSWYLGRGGHRPRRPRGEDPGARLGGHALGQLHPRHAQLALQAAGLRLRGRRPRRLHDPRRGRAVAGGLAGHVRDAGSHAHPRDEATPARRRRFRTDAADPGRRGDG